MQIKIDDEIMSAPEAVQKGLLVDVTAAAAELGYTEPVYITRAIWDEIIDGDKQSPDSRLWDILFAADLAIGRRIKTVLATGFFWQAYMSALRFITRNPAAEDTIPFSLEMSVQGQDMEVGLQITRDFTEEQGLKSLIIMGFD